MKILMVLIALTTCSPASSAGETADDARLRAALSDLDVTVDPAALPAAPISGFLVVTRGLQVLYLSTDGTLLINGDILSLDDQTNLTEQSRAAVRRELLASVPLTERIVVPASAATRARLVVFVDTNCPYCLELHRQREDLSRNGIEVHYLFYPRAGPRGHSFSQAVATWCAADRLAALEAALRGESLGVADCANPVVKHYELARELDLKGTPAIITEDGMVRYGALSRREIADIAARDDTR